MIGWRYHLISIVAVFLALALGLLIGTAFLNDRLVADLQARTEALQLDRDAQAEELRELRLQAERTYPYLVEGRLQGLDVVILTHAGADGEALARARAAIDRSGARVVTTVELLPTFTTPSADDAARLAEIVGVPVDSDAESVADEASRQLARRLADGPLVGPDDGDLLARLVLGEFLRATDPEIETVRAVGGADQAFVMVGGSSSDPSDVPSEVVVRLAQELTDDGATIAVAEDGATSVAGVVAAVREDVSDGRGPVITVDNIAEPYGGAALVLALARARGTGEGGDFGRGDGAEPLPPLAA